MNENEFDKFEIEGDDAVFTLAPKGLLMKCLMDNFGIEFEDSRIDDTWKQFEQWARTHYGKGEKIASIVFNRAGGEFYSLNNQDQEQEDGRRK